MEEIIQKLKFSHIKVKESSRYMKLGKYFLGKTPKAWPIK
jgi:hypothetical protein